MWTVRSVYGAGFRSRWGHFLELNEGKNEGGSGKSRGSGIKSRMERDKDLSFAFFF